MFAASWACWRPGWGLFSMGAVLAASLCSRPQRRCSCCSAKKVPHRSHSKHNFPMKLCTIILYHPPALSTGSCKRQKAEAWQCPSCFSPTSGRPAASRTRFFVMLYEQCSWSSPGPKKTKHEYKIIYINEHNIKNLSDLLNVAHIVT